MYSIGRGRQERNGTRQAILLDERMTDGQKKIVQWRSETTIKAMGRRHKDCETVDKNSTKQRDVESIRRCGVDEKG